MCQTHTHKVTLATEQRHWLEVTQRKALMQTKTPLEYVWHSEGGYTMNAYSLRKEVSGTLYIVAHMRMLHQGTFCMNCSEHDVMETRET